MASLARSLVELLAAIGNAVLARRTGSVSVQHLVFGTIVGLSYRILESTFAGRFRDTPGRYLAFFACWIALSWPLRPEEEAAELSLGSGVCLGSMLYGVATRDAGTD